MAQDEVVYHEISLNLSILVSGIRADVKLISAPWGGGGGGAHINIPNLIAEHLNTTLHS